MDRGAAMLAVVLDVYEGGKDLVPGWKLKEHAETAFATGGIEGILGYSQQPSRMAAMIEGKIYGDPAIEGDPYTEEGGEG